jgi:hypothetical protein
MLYQYGSRRSQRDAVRQVRLNALHMYVRQAGRQGQGGVGVVAARVFVASKQLVQQLAYVMGDGCCAAGGCAVPAWFVCANQSLRAGDGVVLFGE